jgi:hypothetical protein
MKKIIIIIVLALVVIAAGIYLFSKDAQSPAAVEDPYTGKSSRELALTCLPQEQLVMHIHPELKIMINGQQREVPPNIGIQPNCLHFLHTHDNTGKIHIESPVQKDYHLSDFFAVWDQPFSAEQILDAKVDDSHRIRMTVNGQDNTEYGDLVLHDGDQIVIIYEAK